MSLTELEDMRRANEERLKQLEDIYNRKKENTGVGRVIRERMGFKSNDDEIDINERDDDEDNGVGDNNG